MASQNPAAKAKVPMQTNFTPKHKDSRHYLEEQKESSLLNSSFQGREERPSHTVFGSMFPEDTFGCSTRLPGW